MWLILFILLISLCVHSIHCGYTDHENFVFLVAGGHRPKDHLVLIKHIVSLRSRAPQKFFGDNHFCAGTIIAPRLILTAAHCVMDKRKVLTRPRRFLVVAGTPNRLRCTNTTRQYPVQAVRAHKGFIIKSTHDIALLKLKEPITFDNETTQMIALPKEPPRYGSQCIVLGWGRIYADGPLAAVPTSILITLYTPEECKEQTALYSEGMLCAGDPNQFLDDPCSGDSGGPLICDGILTGIISWTFSCGNKQSPSLYTDIYYFRKWIEINRGRKSMTVSIVLYIFMGFMHIICITV